MYVPIQSFQINTRHQDLNDESKSKVRPDFRKIHSMTYVDTLHTTGSVRLQKAPILLQYFFKYFRPKPTSPEMETGTNN